MSGAACRELLEWALPRLNLTWEGFRRVRRQVCRRIDTRIKELGLPGMAAYRNYLEGHEEEWPVLDACCLISISRFGRDREVFERLADTVLPERATEGRGAFEGIRAWSAGCASGEEPYTLAIYWRLRLQPRFPDVALEIVATDLSPVLLERARAGRYSSSSLRELPEIWRADAFVREEGEYVLKEEFRRGVEFRLQDMRVEAPPGLFDLVLCRNAAFTYFDMDLQRRTLECLRSVLRPGGALVIGRKEALPGSTEGPVKGLREWIPGLGIYRRSGSAGADGETAPPLVGPETDLSSPDSAEDGTGGSELA